MTNPSVVIVTFLVQRPQELLRSYMFEVIVIVCLHIVDDHLKDAQLHILSFYFSLSLSIPTSHEWQYGPSRMIFGNTVGV